MKAEHPSPGLKAALDHLPRTGASVLDLGQALAANVAFFQPLGVRLRIADSVIGIGESLQAEPETRAKVEDWIVRGAKHLVAQYGVEITSIITETIERWDADDASRRIELHVGRDLQFIRINGTVVGSLAGLVIYTVAQIIF